METAELAREEERENFERGNNMKLTIGTISKWWDGLEWQEYRTPGDNMYDLCNRADLIKGVICETDKSLHLVADNLGLEYMYKIINHNVDKIVDGFISEYHHMAEVITCFPC